MLESEIKIKNMAGRIIKELKRRNVFRVAAIYLIAGWILMQVADVMFPTLQLPDWSTRLLAAFLMLGFPLAVILAWVFEITPEGIKKDSEVQHQESITRHAGRRIDIAIIGLLVVALVYVVYVRPPAVSPSNEPTSTTATMAEKSIAVLPFENMSGDPENEYFSDGLSEELLNLLAKIDELKVAARTSSFSFKGRDIPIPDIAKELGVATILEGSVRKSGNRVRVTAQLISAADGYHIWSESYDRELNDIFAIQDEIATKVVAALEVKLLDREAPAAQKTVVANIEAYDYHLKGWHELNQTTTGFVPRAIQNFQKAIELDPEYAPAYAGLARAYLFGDNYGDLTRYESMTKAAPLLDRALELDPNLSDAYVVRSVLMLRTGTVDKALADTEKALQLKPGDVRAYKSMANALSNMGRMDEALAIARQVVEIDPLDLSAKANVAQMIGNSGDFEVADQMFEDLKKEHPDNGTILDITPDLYQNYYRDARAAADYAAVYSLRRDDPWGPAQTARILYLYGETDLGDFWLERARDIAENSRFLKQAQSWRNYATRDFALEEQMATAAVELEPNIPFVYIRLGYVQMHQEKHASALKNFEKAFEITGFSKSGEIPFTAISDLSGLLYLYRVDGNTAAFEALVDRAEPIVRKRTSKGTTTSGYLVAAFYYGAKGDRISALYNLQKAVDAGLSRPLFLEIGVEFRDIRDMPEFQALLSTVKIREAEERKAMLDNPLINISGS